MKQPQVIIIINPLCHQGHGWKRWNSIRSEVFKLLPASTVEIILEKDMRLEIVLLPLLQTATPKYILSAGGDGSMHYLLNCIFQSTTVDINTITLGAIGLGSSNDFLKPFNKKIKNIPVRINYTGASAWHDVGSAIFSDENNLVKKKFFIVNASFGVTAAGNWNFNNPGKLLQFLKSYSTGTAIIYTALKTISGYRNSSYRVQYNGSSSEIMVSNINILKIPFVSGSFHYKQPILPDDGRLGLNICMDMNKKELLHTLYQLSQGKFETGKKRIATYTMELHVSAANPVIFECDGETEKANNITLAVIPQAIKILTN